MGEGCVFFFSICRNSGEHEESTSLCALIDKSQNVTSCDHILPFVTICTSKITHKIAVSKPQHAPVE